MAVCHAFLTVIPHLSSVPDPIDGTRSSESVLWAVCNDLIPQSLPAVLFYVLTWGSMHTIQSQMFFTSLGFILPIRVPKPWLLCRCVHNMKRVTNLCTTSNGLVTWKARRLWILEPFIRTGYIQVYLRATDWKHCGLTLMWLTKEWDRISKIVWSCFIGSINRNSKGSKKACLIFFYF